LRKIQVLVKNNQINHLNDLGVNYVSKDENSSKITPLSFKKDGSFDGAIPEDFFDINTKLASDLWSESD